MHMAKTVASSSDMEAKEQDILYILRLEDYYRYTVPDFPVTTVELPCARVQKVDIDGSLELVE